MAKREVGVDAVAIAPSLSLLSDIASVQQIGNYLPRSPFGDADDISQVTGSDAGVVSNMA